jgi:hypothetical protein
MGAGRWLSFVKIEDELSAWLKIEPVAAFNPAAIGSGRRGSVVDKPHRLVLGAP